MNDERKFHTCVSSAASLFFTHQDLRSRLRLWVREKTEMSERCHILCWYEDFFYNSSHWMSRTLTIANTKLYHSSTSPRAKARKLTSAISNLLRGRSIDAHCKEKADKNCDEWYHRSSVKHISNISRSLSYHAVKNRSMIWESAWEMRIRNWQSILYISVNWIFQKQSSIWLRMISTLLTSSLRMQLKVE